MKVRAGPFAEFKSFNSFRKDCRANFRHIARFIWHNVPPAPNGEERADPIGRVLPVVPSDCFACGSHRSRNCRLMVFYVQAPNGLCSLYLPFHATNIVESITSIIPIARAIVINTSYGPLCPALRYTREDRQ